MALEAATVTDASGNRVDLSALRAGGAAARPAVVGDTAAAEDTDTARAEDTDAAPAEDMDAAPAEDTDAAPAAGAGADDAEPVEAGDDDQPTG